MKRGFIATRDPRIARVELDLVVMGGCRGKGFKNSNIINSFLMGARVGEAIVPISNAGSGLTEESMN